MSKDDALPGWLAIAIAVAVFMMPLRTRVTPALLVLCGAVAGLFVFGGR
jgi:hypothetical protein